MPANKARAKTGKNQVEDQKSKSVLREYAEAIVLAIVLAVIIRTFVVQAFKIPSGSMLPTLQIGDHILVMKFIYGIRIPFSNKVLIPITDPERGDVVVFIYPEDPTKDFIKRVIGVEGDKIEIRQKKLYINDQPVPDEHAHFEQQGGPFIPKPGDNFGPITVPEHKLFVMGDNRDNSHDSRFWGFVDLDAVKGKALIIYWSWDKTKRWPIAGGTGWPRFERIGSIVH